MNIIIPMAGMGTRMRPHTLTMPKPLLKIAGKSIVQRLVEDICTVTTSKVDEIAFVIGDFGKDVENKLCAIAESVGAVPKIYYQQKPLGTGHAIYCAEPSLKGNTVVAFADTLFQASFHLDLKQDGIIWTKEVDDPSQFGVVKFDKDFYISDFIEKPQQFITDLAIIGIYYFRDGENLKNELQYLIDNKISVKGEYQLTDALENMKNKGIKFRTGDVIEWLDCGNKDATINTNSRILFYTGNIFSNTIKTNNTLIIPPCFIGENVVIDNCVIGPFVSIGENSKIVNSVIKESIIQSNCNITNLVTEKSMIGNYVKITKLNQEYNLGDYSEIS